MEFLLEPDVVFLNHGSFGACPRVVHEQYQDFQRRLESQPVRFLQRELPDLLAAARAELAAYIGADDRDVVFVPNPTFAVNEIVRSLRLGPGDAVVTTDHEYGACLNAWRFGARSSGFEIVEVALGATIGDDADFTERVMAGVTDTTKAIFVSHITSPTALTFPIGELCRWARQRGIITVIDGAHVPGQMPLDVSAVDADFYVGACHKWMCAPKGASFFWARSEMQSRVEPLVVGWGWGPDRQFDSGSDFLDHHEWLGTHDPSAYLSVPAAIRFQADHDWPTVRHECHALAVAFVERASELPGVERVHADERFVQMGLVELTQPSDGRVALQATVYERFAVEVPFVSWRDPSGRDRMFVRASFQAYNDVDHVDALVGALAAVAGT